MRLPRTTQPWSSSAPKESWYEKIAQAARAWRPWPGLELDARALRESLTDAVGAEADWLLHPCVNSLTLPPDARQPQRDFLLAAWVAAHSPRPLGRARVSQPLVVWTADGGMTVEAGTHDLCELGSAVAGAEWPFRISLDVWCHSLGFVHSKSWPSFCESPAAPLREQLESEIRAFMRALSLLESVFPDCHEWATSVTRVVVPLYNEGGDVFRSSSTEDLPGVIFMDLFAGEVQILEALVHESAHRHLYLLEADGPLVEPGHTATYHSPLRVEPRPLKGIFLAYHALAYICAFYADAVRAGLVGAGHPDLSVLLEKLDDAERTLTDNRRFLTDKGSHLLDETLGVAEYAR